MICDKKFNFTCTLYVKSASCYELKNTKALGRARGRGVLLISLEFEK